MTVDRTKLRVVARGNHRDGYRGVVEIGFYAALIPFECGHKHPETAEARDCVRKLVWRLLDDHAGVRVTGDAGLDVERLARALALRTDRTDAWVLLPKQMQDLWRKDAAAIAREYAALATQDQP